MSNPPKKRGPKPQGLRPYTAMLTEDQMAQVHAEGPRRGNQLIRDALDFVNVYRDLFLSWRATRGNSAID